jgi:hypothetical protein
MEAWTGPNQGHLAAQDIKQLRQFVDAEAPEHFADWRDPRVFFEPVQSVLAYASIFLKELPRIELALPCVVSVVGVIGTVGGLN